MEPAKKIQSSEQWTRLCRIEDVREGAPLNVEVEGLNPLAVYEVNSKFFVTDNLCTHGNALLSDGYQDGGTIECALHGGAFDIRTGAPTTLPCQIPLKIYEVRVDDGWIAIDAETGTEM